MPFPLFRDPYHFFYRKHVAKTYFYIRWLNLKQDIGFIHRWVNEPYAQRYWQMQGSVEELVRHHAEQQEQCIAKTFIACHKANPIALFETYQVIQTEVADHYSCTNEDYGIHLLMGPYQDIIASKRKVGKLSEQVLSMILEMLFSFSSVMRIIAEPDINNTYAHLLAEKVGFKYQKDIHLKDKTAKLYMITREEFELSTLN